MSSVEICDIVSRVIFETKKMLKTYFMTHYDVMSLSKVITCSFIKRSWTRNLKMYEIDDLRYKFKFWVAVKRKSRVNYCLAQELVLRLKNAYIFVLHHLYIPFLFMQGQNFHEGENKCQEKKTLDAQIEAMNKFVD